MFKYLMIARGMRPAFYEKGGDTTTTSQNYSPAEAAQRAQLMGEANRVYTKTQANIKDLDYQGAKPVGPSEATTQGQQSLMTTAGQMQGMSPEIMAAMSRGLGATDVANNPVLQAAIQSSQNSMQDQFQRSGGALEAIRTGAQGAGYGSSRQGIAQGLAMQGLAKEQGNVAAGMNMDAYKAGLQTQTQTLAMSPQIQQSLLLPGQIQSAVGQQQEAYAGDTEAYNAASRDWTLNKEWAPMQNYANMVFGAGSSQSQTTAPGAKGNKAMGALGGAAAGFAVGGPYGAVAGGLIGLLSS